MNNRPLPVYYVSAHSSITDDDEHLGQIPDNRYLIMTTECGNMSYINNHNNFLSKWLSTNKGIEKLSDLVSKHKSPVFLNGKRIYRPGKNMGPVDQVLEFAKSAKNTFFLGIQRAPINIKKIKGDAVKRIKQIPRTILVQVYTEIYALLYGGTNSESNTDVDRDPYQDPNNLSTEKLIGDITWMIKMLVGGGGANPPVSPEQIERVILDPEYSYKLLKMRTIPVEYVVSGNKTIGRILNEGPKGIYIMDTCRVIHNISNYKGQTTAGTGTLKKRKPMYFPTDKPEHVRHLLSNTNYENMIDRIKTSKNRRTKLRKLEYTERELV